MLSFSLVKHGTLGLPMLMYPKLDDDNHLVSSIAASGIDVNTIYVVNPDASVPYVPGVRYLLSPYGRYDNNHVIRVAPQPYDSLTDSYGLPEGVTTNEIVAEGIEDLRTILEKRWGPTLSANLSLSGPNLQTFFNLVSSYEMKRSGGDFSSLVESLAGKAFALRKLCPSAIVSVFQKCEGLSQDAKNFLSLCSGTMQSPRPTVVYLDESDKEKIAAVLADYVLQAKTLKSNGINDSALSYVAAMVMIIIQGWFDCDLSSSVIGLVNKSPLDKFKFDATLFS